jgi:hypothetical protein
VSYNSEQNLLKADKFYQNSVCHLPTSILTAKFVVDKVSSKETQALLGDLRRPHSRLLATYGDSKRLHIFEETNMTWLFACDRFPLQITNFKL